MLWLQVNSCGRIKESGLTMSDCQKCKEWGETIYIPQNYHYISCPNCKRKTFPNLGVNCPAGMAVAFGYSRILEQEKLSMPEKVMEFEYYFSRGL